VSVAAPPVHHSDSRHVTSITQGAIGGHRAVPWLVALLLLGCGGDHRTPVVLYSPHGRDQLTLLERECERGRPDIDVRWVDM